MLITMFKGNRLSGSGEEDFFEVYTIYGHGSHPGHVIWTKYIFFFLFLSLSLSLPSLLEGRI